MRLKEQDKITFEEDHSDFVTYATPPGKLENSDIKFTLANLLKVDVSIGNILGIHGQKNSL